MFSGDEFFGDDITSGPIVNDTACGTTGCEAHDGECRNNWGDFNAPEDSHWRPM